eukprot:8856260-Pyramimonas_sp.AAC.1
MGRIRVVFGSGRRLYVYTVSLISVVRRRGAVLKECWRRGGGGSRIHRVALMAASDGRLSQWGSS